MTNYDLTSIGAVSASAKLAHIRANQELDQSSYNAAWLHGYADALTNVADALEHQQELSPRCSDLPSVHRTSCECCPRRWRVS